MNRNTIFCECLRLLVRANYRGIINLSDPRQGFLRKLPDRGRVLEIGCGRGENCAWLHALHPNVEIHGLDLLSASEVPDFIHYLQHNLEKLPLPYSDNFFDAILLIHVLEHLRDPVRLCSQIHRLLTPGGRLYVEAPNFTSALAPSFGLRRGQHHPFNFYDDLEHVRPYTKQSLYEFVERCQLRVMRVANTRNWVRFPIDLAAFPWALLRGHRPEAVRRFWNLWGWSIYALGRKKAASASADKNL